MRAVIQRVSEASVEVAGEIVGRTGIGLLVLLGVGHGDSTEDARLLAEQTAGLRIFADAAGKFNQSLNCRVLHFLRLPCSNALKHAT